MTIRTKSGLPVNRKRLRDKSEDGIALILTLAILVMVTLLVVAFAISMRVENTASKNFNDLLKARQLAQAGVDQAVATIHQATTRGGSIPAGTILSYVTFPGVIYDYTGALPAVPMPLYSVNAAAPVSLNTVNLNTGFWITQANGELAAGGASNAQFNVGWLYVAQDGTVGPSTLVNHGAIIGRYAFWTDDEASKINLNTAGAGPYPPLLTPDYGISSNQYVDLTMLLPGLNAFVGGIEATQALTGFTTIEEVKRADPSDSDYTANQFELTTYSNDANYPNYVDDLDSFGVPRRVLSEMTNATAIAIDPLDFNNAPMTNINAIARLSDATTLGKIYTGTFDTKYTSVGLTQIVANIVGYQIVDLTTQWPPEDPTAVIPAPPAYLGVAKTANISEIQIRYDFLQTAPTTYQVTRQVKVELFNMYDAPFTTKAGDYVVVSNLPPISIVGGLPNAATISVSAGSIPSGASSQFATVFTSTNDVATFVNPLGQVTLPAQQITATYVRSYAAGLHRLNFAAAQLPVNIVTLPSALPAYQDCEVIGDPALNNLNSPTEWATHKDGDGARLGMCAFPPVGADTSKCVIRGGPMQSVGELGYIHLPGVLFGYLTLQPGGNGGPGQIPDWAMLDLFTVGNAVVPNVAAGRININSFINPGATGPTTPRLVPLKALLNSASSIFSPTTVGQLAQQIYNDTRAAADTYGMNEPGTLNPIFDTIGEICEATGVADTGANAAAKEATIRRIANLITVRSSTFTVWVMAQTIKQPPINSTPGTYNPAFDTITGEVRVQAVVERYENPPGSAPKFRIRYLRYL